MAHPGRIRRWWVAATVAGLLALSLLAGRGAAPASADGFASFPLVNVNSQVPSGTVRTATFGSVTLVDAMLLRVRPNATYTVSICSASGFPTTGCNAKAGDTAAATDPKAGQLTTDRFGNGRLLATFLQSRAPDLVQLVNTASASDIYVGAASGAGENAALSFLPGELRTLCISSGRSTGTPFALC